MKDILAMGAQPDLVSCQTKVISTHIKTEISTTMSGKPDQLRKLLTMPPKTTEGGEDEPEETKNEILITNYDGIDDKNKKKETSCPQEVG